MTIWNTPELSTARAVAERLMASGATECMLVGGMVRDQMMGIESKDVDIEVYGLTYEQIVAALAADYFVDLVGQSFGVVKVDHGIDISIPRWESKAGVGHKGFDVFSDPHMTPEGAAARRDFTINSMGIRFNGEIFDPFGGQEDIRRGILRATSAAFKEDPLRALRGMQFAARFGFDMDASTVDFCRQMIGEFVSLSVERVWEEWFKWATKGRYPGKGLLVLEKTGWIACFPELAGLRSVPQDPIWHPEGDVFIHTCHTCDAAREIADREGLDSRQRAILMFAVLSHDLGKLCTTVRDEHGRWVAPGHSEIGRDLARSFLGNLRAPLWLVDSVVPLVGEHMASLGHPKASPPSARVLRRLATRLSPTSIRLWAAVCEADHNGRPPREKGNPVSEWVRAAEQLGLQDERPRPLLMGRHLIPLGYEPDPRMGRILKAAYEAQLDGTFETPEEGAEWVQASFPRETVAGDLGLVPDQSGGPV